MIATIILCVLLFAFSYMGLWNVSLADDCYCNTDKRDCYCRASMYGALAMVCAIALMIHMH